MDSIYIYRFRKYTFHFDTYLHLNWYQLVSKKTASKLYLLGVPVEEVTEAAWENSKALFSLESI